MASNKDGINIRGQFFITLSNIDFRLFLRKFTEVGITGNKLKPQFEKMKAGSRIVSHQFPIPGIEPEKDFLVKSEETGQEHRILLYRLPLKEKKSK